MVLTSLDRWMDAHTVTHTCNLNETFNFLLIMEINCAKLFLNPYLNIKVMVWTNQKEGCTNTYTELTSRSPYLGSTKIKPSPL